MANRSYIYTVDTLPDRRKKQVIRSLGEFGWEIPIAYKVLAGSSPRRCRSVIWTDQEIGVAADFREGSARLLQLLEVLGASKVRARKAFDQAVAETKAALASKKHAGKWALLECGELFDLREQELVKSAEELVTVGLPSIAKEVDAAIAGARGPWIEQLARDWQKTLGLEWSEVLYFDFGT